MIRLKPWFAAVLLVIVVALVYANTMGDTFTRWDDDKHLFANPHLYPVTLKNVAFFWKQPYLNLYVPLSYTVFALLALVSLKSAGAGLPPTLDPTAFHLANIGLHAANAVFVFFILRTLTRRSAGSICGALLFAVHPLQVESVAWMSELRGLLSAFFSLISILLYIRYIRLSRASHGNKSDRFGRAALIAYGLAIFALALAMLSKPSAAALPLVFFLIDAVAMRRKPPAALLSALPSLAIVVPLILLTQHAQPVPSSLRVAIFLRPLIAADALAFYMAKLVLPMHMATDYGRTPQFVLTTGRAYYDWIAPVAVGALVWLFGRKNPNVIAGTLIAVAFLVPVLGLTPFIFQLYSTVSDRYCYLAVVGVSLVLAAVLAKSGDLRPHAVCVLILAVFAIQTLRQEAYWKNTITLMQHTVSINPMSGWSYQNLGVALEEKGRLVEALASFRNAERLLPPDSRVEEGIGSTLLDMGRSSEAEKHFRVAVALDPTNGFALYNLGEIAYGQGDAAGALRDFKESASVDPSRIDSLINAGMIEIQERRYSDAVAALSPALEERPAYPPLRKILGVAFAHDGRPDMAEIQLGEAVALDPSDSESRLLHGVSLLILHRKSDGLAEFAEAQKLIGNPAQFKQELNAALATMGVRVTVR